MSQRRRRSKKRGSND